MAEDESEKAAKFWRDFVRTHLLRTHMERQNPAQMLLISDETIIDLVAPLPKKGEA
jgi:hypothetical protein